MQKEAHRNLMWTLLVGGILLICFEGMIGKYWIADYLPDGRPVWNVEEARIIASQARTIGILLFAAGLVERLAIVIMDAKNAERS